MSAIYRNPWHKPGQPQYGPEVYETDARPTEYRGYLIYQRIKGAVWDIVKDGVCVGMNAGPDGAKRRIDVLVGRNADAA